MASFEWMELQSLTHDITESRSRLAAARSSKDTRLARQLESEIAEAEQRRSRLLAQITSQLATDGGGPPPDGGDVDQAAAGPDAAAAIDADDDSDEQPLELVNPIVDVAAEAPPAKRAERTKGARIVWDQLSAGDIERAKQQIITRRAEMLARHAEELKALEADQSELDGLEQAIGAFLRKFAAPGEGEVVKLDEKRELRLQDAS